MKSITYQAALNNDEWQDSFYIYPQSRKGRKKTSIAPATRLRFSFILTGSEEI